MSSLELARGEELEALDLDTVITGPEAIPHLLNGVTPRIITRWRQRGLVTPVGQWRGQPLYRFADLVGAERNTRIQAQRSHRGATRRKAA